MQRDTMLYRLEQSRTFRALELARRRAFHIDEYRMDRDRYVILSDVHKGDRSGKSDDFHHNDMIYCHALQYYFDHRYRLILNGDAEDCWECNPKSILHAYKKTAFAIERQYNSKRHYYYRTFGNHDDVWQHEINVHKYLVPAIGHVTCHPAIMLGKDMMIVHGHQGDLWADDGAGITRHIIHHVWKQLEDRSSSMNSRAAYNNNIRNTRDKCLFTWALNHKIVLFAGHTHRAMFSSLSRVDQLRGQCEKILSGLNAGHSQINRALLQSKIDKLQREIVKSEEENLADKTKNRLGEDPLPCYFNSGCCVYRHGMTGIEIDRGHIRLIKWEKVHSNNSTICSAEIQRSVFQQTDLSTLVQKIKSNPHVHFLYENQFAFTHKNFKF